ncbi:ATP-dependent DNA helicase [Candidatus Woesearchaeota archaeon]|nr:ATP-dependent DNA helicase [Candidatus Woesearchaeota archaeon]
MQLYFPHETIRPIQQELITVIQEGLQEKKPVIVHAPTGLGKTAAALSAAVSFAIAEKEKRTVLFVTPKHTQHKIAIDTLRTLKEKYNLDLIVVDLIGKKHMCAQPGVQELKGNEFYDYCRGLVDNGKCDFYNRVKQKNKINLETEEVINELTKKILHVEELREVSIKHKVCPFEVACLVGQKAKVIIADYHHVLNQGVREHVMRKLNLSFEECIVIIDEGHNLAEHCRALLSTQTSTLLIESAKKEAVNFGWNPLAEDLEKIKIDIEKKCQEKIIFTQSEALVKKEEMDEILNKTRSREEIIVDLEFLAEEVKEIKKHSMCGMLAAFLKSWEGPDIPFIRLMKRGFSVKGKPNITLTYRCLDPSLLLKPVAEAVANLIVMSGTLTPVQIYNDIFGFEAKTKELKNPFPKKNKLSIILPETSTKYSLRENSMFERIAQICSSAIAVIPGNTAIFFPSYDLRDKVSPYLQRLSNKTLFFEQQRMSKQEKQELIERFKQYKDAGAVLLGAAAGNFGEGLDMKGNILKAVIIVGLPLAKPDIETQELIKYYDQKFGKGWDYGYTMPAMVKCLQNAGRCIRSETDKGVVIYLDERFAWENYKKYISVEEILIARQPWEEIKKFFADKNE